MSGLTQKFVIGAMFGMLLLVAVPAPAAAHDHGCVTAVHFGPITFHYGCDHKYKGDNSECFLSYNILIVHDDIMC